MPPQPPRKRPWYLVAALLGALAFGVNGSFEGWSIWTFYHSERVDPSAALDGISLESSRQLVAQAFDHLAAAQDAATARVYPIGIALLLIGVTMMFFALRAMGGRGTARPTLVQLVVAQAAVWIACFFMTKDLRAAEIDFANARTMADAHEQAAQNPEAERAAGIVVRVMPFIPALSLIARSIGSALIVLALTRPRSREFFEAARDPATEP